MEPYKAKLKMGQRITAIAAAVIVCFFILFVLSELGILPIAPATGDEHWQSMWRGFVSGACGAIAAMMIRSYIITAKALHSEEALKKRYIRDHDERQIQIWTAARAASTQLFLMAGLVAGVIAGYFNMTVSITVLACVTAHSLIALGFKIYYSKKY